MKITSTNVYLYHGGNVWNITIASSPIGEKMVTTTTGGHSVWNTECAHTR